MSSEFRFVVSAWSRSTNPPPTHQTSIAQNKNVLFIIDFPFLAQILLHLPHPRPPSTHTSTTMMKHNLRPLPTRLSSDAAAPAISARGASENRAPSFGAMGMNAQAAAANVIKPGLAAPANAALAQRRPGGALRDISNSMPIANQQMNDPAKKKVEFLVNLAFAYMVCARLHFVALLACPRVASCNMLPSAMSPLHHSCRDARHNHSFCNHPNPRSHQSNHVALTHRPSSSSR
jgi:hypothetical protein